MKLNVKNITISRYVFGDSDNPYCDISDTGQVAALNDIAQHINGEIHNMYSDKKLIIRGIQSGKHKMNRDQLIQVIIENGQEYDNSTEPHTIFAAPYDGLETTKHILEGFHMYKPKCEERPQYPVDIWLVFDAGAYENVEYIHPRYKVPARDKWKRVDAVKSGLLKIVVVN